MNYSYAFFVSFLWSLCCFVCVFIGIMTINYLLLLHIDNKLLSLLLYFMINKREYEQIDKTCRL